MGELEQVQSGPESNSPAKADVLAAGDESLMRLHKMSTTAGVGTQDYVAINAMAVSALPLAAAGILLMLLVDSWVMALAPVLALTMGIVALRQIGSSNGTQTGRALAVLAIILSVAVLAFKGAVDWRQSAAMRVDREEIIDSTRRLGELVRNGKFDEAYAMFDDVFRSRVTLNEFVTRWKTFDRADRSVQLVSVQSGGIVQFSQAPGSVRLGQTIVEIAYSRVAEGDAESNRQSGRQNYTMFWVKDSPGGRYEIRSFELFPPPQPEEGGEKPPAPK